jgi:hypothetical protein
VLVGVASVAVPSSNCYALDNSSRIVDFVSYIHVVINYVRKKAGCFLGFLLIFLKMLIFLEQLDWAFF